MTIKKQYGLRLLYLSFLFLLIASIPVFAQDSPSSARQINFGEEVKGNVSYYHENEFWYSFNVPSDGAITISFSHSYEDSPSEIMKTTLLNQCK